MADPALQNILALTYRLITQTGGLDGSDRYGPASASIRSGTPVPPKRNRTADLNDGIRADVAGDLDDNVGAPDHSVEFRDAFANPPEGDLRWAKGSLYVPDLASRPPNEALDGGSDRNHR